MHTGFDMETLHLQFGSASVNDASLNTCGGGFVNRGLPAPVGAFKIAARKTLKHQAQLIPAAQQNWWSDDVQLFPLPVHEELAGVFTERESEAPQIKFWKESN